MIVFLALVNHGVKSTFDVNVHEIQYVADHVTSTQCRHLLDELYKTRRVTESERPTDTRTRDRHIPCIVQLLKWNEQDGSKHSFHGLADALRKIGRADLSGKLSRKVYGEKVSAVKEAFLDDPFKGLVHTGSPLLEESQSGEVYTAPSRPAGWTAIHTLSVVCIAATVMLGAGVLVKHALSKNNSCSASLKKAGSMWAEYLNVGRMERTELQDGAGRKPGRPTDYRRLTKA